MGQEAEKVNRKWGQEINPHGPPPPAHFLQWGPINYKLRNPSNSQIRGVLSVQTLEPVGMFYSQTTWLV